MARAKHALRRAPVLTRAQRAAVRDATKSASIRAATPRKSSTASPKRTKSPSPRKSASPQKRSSRASHSTITPARLQRQKMMSKALAQHAAEVVNLRGPRRAIVTPRKRSSGSPRSAGKSLAREATRVVKQRQVVADEAQKLIREQNKLARAAKSLVKAAPRRRGPQTPGGTHLLRGPAPGKKRGERMTLALKRIIDFNKRNPGKVSTFRASGAPANSKTFVIPLHRANNDFGKAFIVQGGRPSVVLNESIKHLRRNLPNTLILVRRRVSKADGSHSTEATTFHLAVRDGQIHPTLQHKNIMSPATFNFLMREHA